jgi:signal transduction histidine kinase
MAMNEPKRSLPLVGSLSARLLVFTAVFVMLAEVLIYAPSIARYRWTYFEDHIASGHLAALALEATPDNNVSPDLERELLRHVGAHGVVLQRAMSKALVLSDSMPPEVDVMVNLERGSFIDNIVDAFVTLAQTGNRVIRVRGPSPQEPNIIVEVILDEAPLRHEMYEFSGRILGLSIVISLIAGALVYITLHWLMVRPMRRLTESMIAFREHPEDPTRMTKPSRRRDEIGLAEREFAVLQSRLRAALGHRARLATLGEAVAKINHDLRGILSTAQLVSDRLASSNDPEVRRATPVLMKSIDRAVTLCSRILDFSKPRPDIAAETFALGELATDVAAALSPVLPPGAEVSNGIPADFDLYADRDQLFRVLSNLMRNAVEAGATRVAIGARHESSAPGRRAIVEIADNGPGLPEPVRQRLFQPFAGSSRNGGSGLGLAIARDLALAHGGDLTLVSTGPDGTAFRLSLPQPVQTGPRSRRPAPRRAWRAAV